MEPDAIIRVRFNTTEENGRRTPVSGKYIKYYGCPMFIGDGYFDCRLYLEEEQTLELGETYEVPVKFLWPEGVLPYLKEGTPFTLWEGRDIAKGVILRVFLAPK